MKGYAAVLAFKATLNRQPDWIDEKDGEEGKQPCHYESRGDVPPLHCSSVMRKLCSLAFYRSPPHRLHSFSPWCQIRGQTLGNYQ